MTNHRAALKRNVKKGLKKLLPVMTVTFTAAPFALWAQPVQAFFPPVLTSPPPVVVVPPISPPPVIVVPPVSPPPFVPPVSPPPIVVPPVSPPPIVVPPVSPPPCGVPEPATLVSSLIGLAAAAGYGIRRKKTG